MTTTTVLLLENIEQKQARRIAAAIARHPNPAEPAYIYSDHNSGTVYPPFQAMTPEQIYQTAEYAAKVALRRRAATSGVQLFNDLLSKLPQDRANRNSATLAAGAGEYTAEQLEAAAAKHNTEAAAYTRTANSITRPDKERIAAANLAAEERAKAAAYTAAAEAERAALKDINAALFANAGSGYTEDMIQAAAVEIVAQAAAHTNATKAVHAAAGQEMRQLAHPDAMTRNETKVQPLTKAAATEQLTRYAVDLTQDPPKHYETRSKGNKNTYVTFEARLPKDIKKLLAETQDTEHPAKAEAAKAKLATYEWYGDKIVCKITHRYTVSPYVSFEVLADLAEDEDPQTITTNGGINAIFDQTDSERIIDLITRANLTEKERKVIYKAADQTAANYAKPYRQAAIAEQREKWEAKADKSHPTRFIEEATKAVAKATARARWESAFDRCNIYNDNTRSDLKKRIKKALFAAWEGPEQGPITPEEHQEQETRKYGRLMKDSRRGCSIDSRPAPDMVKVWTEASKMVYIQHLPNGGTATTERKVKPAAPVIDWKSSPTCCTVTAEEIKAAEDATRAARTAEMNAHGAEIAAIEYRRIITAHITPADWTQTRAEQYTKTQSAAAAALAIFDNWTPTERAAAAAAARAEEEAAKAAAKAEEEAKKAAEEAAAQAAADKAAAEAIAARKAYAASPAGIMAAAEAAETEAAQQTAAATKAANIAKFYAEAIAEAMTTHPERQTRPGYMDRLRAQRKAAEQQHTTAAIAAAQAAGRAERLKAKAAAHPGYAAYMAQLEKIAEAAAKKRSRKKA